MEAGPYPGVVSQPDADRLVVLVYVSAATRELSGQELRALLKAARAHNVGAGITGMLLYHRGGFMQALEGPQSRIDALYARIARDARHRNLIVVTRQPRARREFEAWSMGFVDLSQADVPEGFSPLLHEAAVREAYAASPDRVHKFLSHYARAAAPA